MNKTLNYLLNKLGITCVLICMGFSTAVLHNNFIKNYEHSILAKYNVLSTVVNMSQEVNEGSMKDLEHKIRVRVEFQKVLISILKNIPILKEYKLVKTARPIIKLKLYSGGGSVLAGFGVMNLMKSYQDNDRVFFYTVADKFCYSMCFALLQQGDYRTASYYTILGTHRAAGGDQRVLRLIEKMMAKRVIERSLYFNDYEQWKKFYWSDFFHNPELALKYDLIDELEKEL